MSPIKPAAAAFDALSLLHYITISMPRFSEPNAATPMAYAHRPDGECLLADGHKPSKWPAETISALRATNLACHHNLEEMGHRDKEG